MSTQLSTKIWVKLLLLLENALNSILRPRLESDGLLIAKSLLFSVLESFDL